MTINTIDLGEGEIILQHGVDFSNRQLEVMERKGWGHPDKLADDLAEMLSRTYSRYTLKECGAILHHNFDKLCLLGGSSEVSYGLGKMIRPIKVLVNGRATARFGDKILEVDDLLINTCKEFFKIRLPLIDCEKDLDIFLNLSTASSPGKVYSSKSKGARHHWFNPRNLEDLPEYNRLYANDTSLGTGFFPLSPTERLVIQLTDYLSKRPRKDCPSWLGTDVKVMACSFAHEVALTICVPQIAQYIKDREEYHENLEWLRNDIKEFMSNNFPNIKATFNLNARDDLESEELYLTATGSSIESGDEGVVGRGNRVNGLITPMRPMNLEGANGKNPVYHVGKLYNVLANLIAKEIHNELGGTVIVNLISKTGGDLLTPWKTVIQLENKDGDARKITNIVRRICSEIPELTQKIIASSIEDMPLS